MYIVVGLIMFALYFVIFRFLILRFNMKTPGRKMTTKRRVFTASRITRRKATTTGWARRSLKDLADAATLRW
jgi:PTS system maltose and glucose-specific IIC component